MVLIVKYDIVYFIGNMLCRLQYQFEVLQFVIVRWYLYKDSDIWSSEIFYFRIKGFWFYYICQVE